jgi:hypothetical protein
LGIYMCAIVIFFELNNWTKRHNTSIHKTTTTCLSICLGIFCVCYNKFDIGHGSNIVLCVWGPSIASSGIPEVKAYLNGVDTPNVFSLQTLVVKVNVFTPMPLLKKLSLVNACSYHARLLYGVNKQIECF